MSFEKFEVKQPTYKNDQEEIKDFLSKKKRLNNCKIVSFTESEKPYPVVAFFTISSVTSEMLLATGGAAVLDIVI